MEGTSSMDHSVSNLLIPCSLKPAGSERERPGNERGLDADNGMMESSRSKTPTSTIEG